MSYTSKDQLDDQTIHEWTLEDELANPPGAFYAEDIIRVSSEPNFDSLLKCKVKFWGDEGMAWVGVDANGAFLEDVLAVRCPPFHPPNLGGPNIKLFQGDKPAGFPND